MLQRKGFTNLHFGGAVVADSPSKTVAMAQTEHSTAGRNADGHAQGSNYTGCPFSPFKLKKKTASFCCGTCKL
jgi:hypothetical protein